MSTNFLMFGLCENIGNVQLTFGLNPIAEFRMMLGGTQSIDHHLLKKELRRNLCSASAPEAHNLFFTAKLEKVNRQRQAMRNRILLYLASGRVKIMSTSFFKVFNETILFYQKAKGDANTNFLIFDDYFNSDSLEDAIQCRKMPCSKVFFPIERTRQQLPRWLTLSFKQLAICLTF